MNLWVARDMGYHDMTCVTFSQTNSTDERVAQQVGKALNVDNIFWPLDSARHLLHIDEYISMNYGTALYSGVGAMKEILDRLDVSQFGVIHTGQLGDVIIGSYLRREEDLSDFSPGGTYSQLLSVKHSKHDEYRDREEYFMAVRGLLGILSSHFYLRNYTEVVSPFLDIDFFDFCMSIPVRLRANHNIYKKWILTKYPKAAEFVWETTGAKITEMNFARQFRRYKGALMNPKRILRKLGFKVNIRSLTGMNPSDLWWEENKMLRKTYNQYFENTIKNKALSSEIKKDIEFIYTSGNTTEKMMAITALAVVNNFF